MKTLRILACLAFLFAAVPVTNVLAQGGNCTNEPPGVQYVQGTTNSHPSVGRSGVAATIIRDPNITGFRPCKVDAFSGDPGGAFAYIELHPRYQIGGCGANPLGDDCSIQFGVADCWEETINACDQEHAAPYQLIYVKLQGCDGSDRWISYGPPASSTTTFSFYRNTSNQYQFFVNGSQVAVIPTSDSNISCWINGQNAAGYHFMRWDSQDSIGSVSTTQTRMINAQYGVYNQGWFSVVWPENGVCQFNSTDGLCQLNPSTLNSDDFYSYTQQ